MDAETRPVIYSMGVSLDGFIAGPGGEIDWSAPDEELHRFHNEQTRELGVHLCGRRLWEAMVPWETSPGMGTDPITLEFAELWKALPKIVFSITLTRVEGNARLARRDVATELADLRDAAGGAIAVGGAELAATLVGLNLIDEYRLFVSPIVLGGGTRCLPAGGARIDLELIETRTFGSRVVYLRYRRA
jgi:dihydrofolate reductase